MAGRSWFSGIWRLAVLTLGLWALALAAAVPWAAAQQFQPASGSPLDLGVFNVFQQTRDALFSGLANNIGTLPNPTGGGFTYTFDPSLGVFTRSSESFGPVFANRAETTGRGKFTLNTSFSRHTFDTVDGLELRSNSQVFPVLLVPGTLGGQSVLLVDVIQLREEVSADVYTLGGIYGITDRIDVGITIPFLDVKVKERPRELGFFFCTRDFSQCTNSQPTGQDFRSNSASASGLGDIVLRGKWNFLQVPQLWGGRMGMAFALDVKLPTGDEGDRDAFTNQNRFSQGVNVSLADITGQQFGLGDPPLGTGVVRVRPQVVVSGSWAGFAPHVNAGAELGTTEGITNDLVYEVGFDYTFFQRVTVSADLLGRHAFDVDRLRVRNIFDQDFGRKANADTLTFSIGVKANPIGTLLVFANLLFPINEVGIRDRLTPTFGVEWSF